MYKKGTHRIEVGLNEQDYQKALKLKEIYNLRSIADLCRFKIKTDIWFEYQKENKK